MILTGIHRCTNQYNSHMSEPQQKQEEMIHVHVVRGRNIKSAVGEIRRICYVIYTQIVTGNSVFEVHDACGSDIEERFVWIVEQGKQKERLMGKEFPVGLLLWEGLA